MLKFILMAAVALIAGVLIYAATLPDHFRIERSTLIKAPPDQVFPLINDLRQMQAWSAWEKVDPAMQRVYSGATSGVGAVYEWDGNNEIGQGRMTLLESSAPSKVLIKMEFIQPFAAVNTAEFTLTPEGGATRVTHAMFGPSPYIANLMVTLFFDRETMIGDKFAESLASLKAIAERQEGL